MKNIILLLISGACFINLSAQVKRDYNYYNKQIDSLISVYSVDTLKRTNIYSSYFNHSILTDTEKKKLIGRIEKMFEQKEHVNLYRLGHALTITQKNTTMLLLYWEMRSNSNIS